MFVDLLEVFLFFMVLSSEKAISKEDIHKKKSSFVVLFVHPSSVSSFSSSSSLFPVGFYFNCCFRISFLFQLDAEQNSGNKSWLNCRGMTFVTFFPHLIFMTLGDSCFKTITFWVSSLSSSEYMFSLWIKFIFKVNDEGFLTQTYPKSCMYFEISSYVKVL